MIPRRLLALLGVAVGLTALAGGATLLWFRPDADLRVVNNRLVGETTGYVTTVSAEDQTLRVSATVLGLRPITVHVGSETTILVGDKQGALGDLLPGMPVRVGYQMEGNRRIAKIIELGPDHGGPPSTPTIAMSPTASVPLDPPASRASDAPEPIETTESDTPTETAAPAETAPPTETGRPPQSDPVPIAAAPAPPERPVASPAPPPAEPVAELPPRRRVVARAPLSGELGPLPSALPGTLPARESVLDLSASVHDWVAAAKRRDVSAQIALYAERIRVFYGRHDLSREDVRAEKLRTFGSGEALLETGSPEIRLDPNGRVAIVRFIKRFVVDVEGRARYGNAVQELRWERTDAGWRIAGEDDAPMSRQRRS